MSGKAEVRCQDSYFLATTVHQFEFQKSNVGIIRPAGFQLLNRATLHSFLMLKEKRIKYNSYKLTWSWKPGVVR